MIAGIIGITPGRIAPRTVTNSQYRENRALTPLPESLVSPLRPQNRGFPRPCRYRASTIKQKSRGILKTPVRSARKRERRTRTSAFATASRRIANFEETRSHRTDVNRHPAARSLPASSGKRHASGKRPLLNYKNIPWFLPLAD